MSWDHCRPVRKHAYIQRLSTTIRFILLKAFIGVLDGSRVLWRFFRRGSAPLYRFGKKALRFLLTGTILNLYFFVLKLRKKIRSVMISGSQRVVAWINAHLVKLAVAAVILATITFNLTSKPLNAEELNSKILFTDALTGQQQSGQLIEEGPISELALQYNGRYIDDDTILTEDGLDQTPAPDTDNDDVYATTEGDSAIIAPIITNPDEAFATRTKIEIYTVQPGDTLGTISQILGINVNTILWQNNLSWNSTIRPGQALSILPVNGVAHAVKSGDTVAQIAKKYQVDQAVVIEFNKLADASDIRANDVLIVPNGIKPTAVAAAPVSRTLPGVIRDIFVPPALIDSGTRLLWPIISHRITQYFHLRHKGLDIGDKKGNPIYAAESGKVERAGWNTGYGYNVIINHGNGLKTLYGHSSKLLVKVGDTVERGQTIGLVGSTGWSTGPHLHFEVKVNGVVTNPLNYIR